MSLDVIRFFVFVLLCAYKDYYDHCDYYDDGNFFHNSVSFPVPKLFHYYYYYYYYYYNIILLLSSSSSSFLLLLLLLLSLLSLLLLSLLSPLIYYHRFYHYYQQLSSPVVVILLSFGFHQIVHSPPTLFIDTTNRYRLVCNLVYLSITQYRTKHSTFDNEHLFPLFLSSLPFFLSRISVK